MKIKAKQIDFAGVDLEPASIKADNMSSNKVAVTDANGALATSYLNTHATEKYLGIGVYPTAPLDVSGSASGDASIALRQGNNTSDGPDMTFFKSRGTLAAPQLLSQGDVVGRVGAKAYTNSAQSDGHETVGYFGWTAEDNAGSTSFAIATASSGAATESLTVSPQGAVNVSGNLTANSVSAGSLAVSNAYTLPLSDGNANQILVTDGSGNLSFSDNTASADINEVSPGIYISTSYVGLESNRTYSVSPSLTGTLTLDVPVIQRHGGSAGTPVFGAFIDLYNYSSSLNLTFREYSNANGPSVTLLDEEPDSYITGIYYASGFTTTGAGHYRLFCTDASGVWVVSRQLYNTSTMNNIALASALPSASIELSSNISPAGVYPNVTYVVPNTVTTPYTVTLPHPDPAQSASQANTCTALDGQKIYFRNEGYSTITLTRYDDFSSGITYRTYLSDLSEDTYKDALVIGPGEEVSLTCTLSGTYMYYSAKYITQYTRTLYVDGSSNITITPGPERKTIYVVDNGVNTPTLTLPSPNDVAVRKDGYELVIKKLTGANVTLARTNYTIEGFSANYVMTEDYESITLVPVPFKGWYIASSSIKNQREAIRGMVNPILTASTSYAHTQQTSHDLLVFTATSAITATLPDPSTVPAGTIVSVKRFTSSSVTVATNTVGGTIDEVTSDLNLNSDTGVCLVLVDPSTDRWAGLSIYH